MATSPHSAGGASVPAASASEPHHHRALWERPRAAAAAWVELGASSFVSKVISRGYKINFVSKPLPYRQHSIPISKDDEAFALEEIAKNLERGSWVRAERQPDYCAAAFIVRSASGKRRVVIDLRIINEHIATKRFKFETLSTLKGFLQHNDYMVSCDLQSGYHHIAMHEDSVPYLGFSFAGQFFYCKALPFGLSTAPRVFTKVMRTVIRHLRAQHVSVLPYLDDFMFWFRSQAEAAAGAARIDQLFDRLGLQRNPDKGVWQPTQAIQHHAHPARPGARHSR